MKLIHPDHERRYEILGVPGPTRRPVDIDGSKTGFTSLRSLRIYRFETGSVIDGHAEEDELFVLVTSGSVDMRIGRENTSIDTAPIFTLSAPAEVSGHPSMVYLPPHFVYQLTPSREADVAYARATPNKGSSAAIFFAADFARGAGVHTAMTDRKYAQRLRLRMVLVDASEKKMRTELIDNSDDGTEALVHVRGLSPKATATLSSNGQESLTLHHWDSVALRPSENPVLHVEHGTILWILTVLGV